MYRQLTLSLFVSIVSIVAVNAGKALPKGCTIDADPKKSATVACPLIGTVKWSKGGEEIDEDSRYYTIEPTNRTLTVLETDRTHSGEYICNNGTDSETVGICVRPYVQPYDKSKNVIEGDPFQSECVGWGYPTVTFEWIHDKNFSDSEDRKILKNSTNGINAVLRIENMEYEDGGEYTCIVHNELGSVNATIQVNVKDKLAALWPFLAICAEVTILCIIIFLYEKRRAKRMEKEAALAEETEHMNPNNDTKVTDDVRQRK